MALLTAIGISVFGGPARADQIDDEREAEKGRFAVGFALTSGVVIAQQNGEIDPRALDITTPPLFVWPTGSPSPPFFRFFDVAPPEPFGVPVEGSINSISPNIGANLELMTPALDIVPGDPRFFATAEILPTFAPELSVALQGAASEFKIPSQNPNTFKAAAIAGTGSRLRAQVMTTVIAANAGAAFAFEVRERLLRLKPSVGWIRWGVVTSGRVLAAYKNDPIIQPPGAPFNGSVIRLVEVNGRSSGFFNAVGPGLELEMELQKRGPLRPVLYMSGFAYKTVGEDTITFRGSSGPITDGLNPGETATYVADWTFRVDPWSYRAALGMRLRWVGN